MEKFDPPPPPLPLCRKGGMHIMKMMSIKILKSVFYNPFQIGVHVDFFQTCIYVQSAQSENAF